MIVASNWSKHMLNQALGLSCIDTHKKGFPHGHSKNKKEIGAPYKQTLGE